jgi:phosphopantothenoylcysteine decarboxylase / phosphopantothenate---cysteine ligase
VAQLRSDGAVVLDVGVGEQACGENGDGRMLEPEDLVYDIVRYFTPKVLVGQHVLVSAGPTYEAIDPVRGLTNLSSGKMGFALARAAHEAGANVTLVAGPVGLPTPRGVGRINVKSAQNMQRTLNVLSQNATVFVSTAAVADWRPAQMAASKIKKDGSGQVPVLSFVENPDILSGIAMGQRALSRALYCVGFAAESEDLIQNAQLKRQRKGVPLLVGNIGPDTFGQDEASLMLVDDEGITELPKGPKLALARQLVAEIARRLPPVQVASPATAAPAKP